MNMPRNDGVGRMKNRHDVRKTKNHTIKQCINSTKNYNTIGKTVRLLVRWFN